MLPTWPHQLVTLLKGNCVGIVGEHLNTNICKCFIRTIQFIQRLNSPPFQEERIPQFSGYLVGTFSMNPSIFILSPCFSRFSECRASSNVECLRLIWMVTIKWGFFFFNLEHLGILKFPLWSWWCFGWPLVWWVSWLHYPKDHRPKEGVMIKSMDFGIRDTWAWVVFTSSWLSMSFI